MAAPAVPPPQPSRPAHRSTVAGFAAWLRDRHPGPPRRPGPGADRDPSGFEGPTLRRARDRRRPEGTPEGTGGGRGQLRGEEGAWEPIGDTSSHISPDSLPRPCPETGPDELSRADLGVLAAIRADRGLGETCPGLRGVDALPISPETRAAVEDFLGPRPEVGLGFREGAFVELLLHSVLSGDLHVSTDRSGREWPRVKIGHRVLASMMGARSARKTNTEAFLEAYGARVPGFSVVNYYVGSHPRLVGHHGLPDELLGVIERDLLEPTTEFRRAVRAGRGGRFSDPVRRDPATLAQVEAELEAGAPYDVQARLSGHLNGPKTNSLAARVNRNVEEAVQATLDAYPDRARRLVALADLRRAVASPHAVYGPSRRARSVRVFPRSPGVVTLKTPVRRALLRGCVSLDLANSQLAVLARLLGVAPVLDLLEREGTAWPHLVRAASGRDLEGDEFADVKKSLKRAVYGTAYGMSKSGLYVGLSKALSGNAATRFLSDPVVRALLDARDRELARIESVGWTEDVYGRRHAVDGPGFEGAAAGARSALACRAQASEMWLLEPVVDELISESSKGRPDFRVAVWQHDGLTVSISRRGDRAVERLVGLVERRAAEGRIPTRLEVEWL